MTDKNWEIIIIKHGTRATRRSDVYMNYGFYSEPDADFTVDYYFWVLRSGEDIVIIDTGYSAKGAAKRNREVLIDPLLALQHLGIAPEDGHPVVVTHAHYDHIGNVAEFSNSKIYIAAAELEFWTGDLATRPLFKHFGDQEEVADIVAAKKAGRVHEFSGTFQLAPGVELIEVGGHTAGQLVVRVQTTAGVVLLASDAAHFHEEIERDMLFQAMTDLPKSYHALDWIRAAENITVISGHDAGELERFEPLTGPLAGLAAIVGRQS